MYNKHHIHFIIFLNLTGFNDKYHYSLKGYIADEFGPEITQTQKEDAKDGDGEDGPRPKQPRSSADRIGTSEVGVLVCVPKSARIIAKPLIPFSH